MRTVLIFVLMVISGQAFSQYYFFDVLGARESAALMSSYKKNNVHKMSARSYDETRHYIPTMKLDQFYDAGQNMLHTQSVSERDPGSHLYTWANASGQIIKSLDSNSLVLNETVYSYDASGRLVRLTTKSADKTGLAASTEEHVWIYRDNKPVQMLKIKDGVDTAFVKITTDEEGRVVEEQETHKGLVSLPFYYYYNEKNQLSDVVRYRASAKRLLPIYMFEYDEEGRPSQRITIPETNQYLRWKFQYNATGLKSKEAIFDKKNELQGFIDYKYE